MSHSNSYDHESSASSFAGEEVDFGSSTVTLTGIDPVTMNDDPSTERSTLARKEDRAVFWSRILVLVVLATAAALVAINVYKNTARSQQKNFETTFASDSLKVLDSFYLSVERKLHSSDALSVLYTSYAINSGSTFPNVTLPDYQLHSANARIMSESVVFNYHPVVTDVNRKGWEAYARENRNQFITASAVEYGWIEYQNAQYNESDRRGLQNVQDFQDEIGNLGMDGLVHPAPEGTGPYLPIWQLGPATPLPVLLNFNVLSHPAGPAYVATLNSGEAVIHSASNLFGENMGDSGAYFQLVLSMSQFREAFDEYLGDPTSPFSYPVFDSFDPTNRTVAGILSSTFYWKLYLENVLPANRKGIICVLQNSFHQTFTYRIDGTAASYLGVGDLHDPKYDHLEVSSDMTSYFASRSSQSTTSYTVVKLNTAFNAYSLRIYPSKDTEASHVDSEPRILTIAIIFVFVFTSLVFMIYDCMVARRQCVVMNRAVASTSIISSLFPSQVRDKVYEENRTEGKRCSLDYNRGSSATNNLTIESEVVTSSKPNAVLFPSTTIMFADMVGFTAWSSARDPVHVFELLETVYHAFDKIAARRRVFKVETIGDCYVAVAGLPHPQPDHALLMTKFAEDCIAKMRHITAILAKTMGADTASLILRVGLHSGCVTGGVLRGQKSRFQLFGDTMNTASRMESYGIGGQIHASQETADELIAKGKSHWLTSRADKIVAKGKGELRTYWLTSRANSYGPRSSAASSATSDEDELKIVDSILIKFTEGDMKASASK
jgi:class 3 adenylate cyclase